MQRNIPGRRKHFDERLRLVRLYNSLRSVTSACVFFLKRSPEGNQLQFLNAQKRRHSAPDSYRFQSHRRQRSHLLDPRTKENQRHGDSLLSPRSPGGSHPFGVPNNAPNVHSGTISGKSNQRSTDTSRYIQSATGGAIPGPKV